MEDCMSSLRPPPPPRPSNPINDLIREGALTNLTLETLGSALLVVLLLWLVGQAFFKRLWLLPSPPRRILALNAATLSLLGIVAKPAEPGNNGVEADESSILANTGLICAMLGALMPSVAASTDLRDMWSNVVGVGLLVISVNFVTFLQLFYIPDDDYFYYTPTIHGGLARKQVVIMASMFLLLLVLLVQAVALPAMMSDTKTIISERLQNLHMDTKPGYKADVIIKNELWSWELVERNTHIKLMMVLTSNPQNLMARSPSAAIVGTIVVSCLVMSGTDSIFLLLFQGPATVVCGFICIWRWIRVALQEDRPLSTLAFNAEPSYWRRDVNNYLETLKAGPRSSRPNALEEGQWGFREALCYTAAFLMLCFVVPFHKLLVALIRFSQIFSALLVRMIIRFPIKTLGSGIVILCRKLIHKSGRIIDAAAADHSSTSLNSLGMVCLEGEDARIVGQQFAGAANRIIQRQVKRAKKKSDMKALMSHLQSSKSSEIIAAGKSTAILVTLNKDGTPDVENLHVEHGYQFGWSLTVISLLALLANMEATALGRSTMSEAATIAYWQAMEMMQLVDEQFVPCIVCTKETYASACASAWSKLQKKKRRRKERQEIKVDAINQILEATLASTKKEFNKAKNSAPDGMPAAWSQQAVMSYTMHTICRNLLRCWSDVEAAATAANGRGGEERDARKMIEGMVEYINVLIGEVVACCISNLPAALDMSTTDAVLRGSMSDIEKSLVLAAQGKHLWEGLQWPTLHSLRNTRLGQLSQWMH